MGIKDRTYAVKKNIKYTREEGLMGLVGEGFRCLLRKNKKPGYLHFIGEEAQFEFDSNRLMVGPNYFDPTDIRGVRLSQKINDTQQIENFSKYFLRYENFEGRGNSLFFDFCAWNSQKGPQAYGLQIYPYCNIRKYIGRDIDKERAEHIMNGVLHNLGLEKVEFKEEQREDMFMIFESDSKISLGIDMGKIVRVYNHLREHENNMFRFRIYTHPSTMDLISLTFKDEWQELDIFDCIRKNLFDELQELLPDEANFEEIEYDNAHRRMRWDERELEKRLAKERLQDEEIKQELEKGYHKMAIKYGMSNEEAGKYAKGMAELGINRCHIY